MKKVIVFCVCGLVCTVNLVAQIRRNDARGQVQLGAKLGLNLSNVYDEKGQDFVADSKLGLAGGLFLRLPLSEFVGLQPEVLLSQKGFVATGSLFNSSYSITRTSNFIDIPLLVSVKPFGFLTLLAGPQFSYLVKQSNVFKNGTTTILQQKEFDNDNIRKNILCFTGGFDINVQHVVVGARAGWDFQNNHGDGVSDTPRYKNAWYQITFGYRLC
ncbi:MAG: hypothetical protein RL747_377 [Bacteroidota bacterium]|jgi:hypothetical protein